ncbi:peptide deformylase [[Mycoplasma] mobile]|uniref:Peptide deformylase n=1 Tax=Mycoplasma mobile (strain ATCC 43663 / 163K / NCTC 11711) TaxID=267748 RepID=Q6KH28_MYCM1|nr:peptide deformylase [[Mycoplasma] mobile]AAT28103.1 formylmethionine deformylase [Mycoplasma mobile 163K]
MEKYDVKLIELPNKILRQKSLDINLPLSHEDIELAKKMIYHIKNSQSKNTIFRPGVGVAAVQYGILKQMFYVYITDEDNKVVFEDLMINPKVLAKSTSKIALRTGEGCLSVNEEHPNQEGYVKRSKRIVVKGYSYFKKEEVTHDLNGYPAIVFQHELDHLNGKLFIDHIDKENNWFIEKDLELY